MIYQLPNGRVVEISIEQFLEMTDDDIEYLIAYNIGDFIENPFYGSALSLKDKEKKKKAEEPEEIEKDITSISSIEKLKDLDIQDQDE